VAHLQLTGYVLLRLRKPNNVNVLDTTAFDITPEPLMGRSVTAGVMTHSARYSSASPRVTSAGERYLETPNLLARWQIDAMGLLQFMEANNQTLTMNGRRRHGITAHNPNITDHATIWISSASMIRGHSTLCYAVRLVSPCNFGHPIVHPALELEPT